MKGRGPICARPEFRARDGASEQSQRAQSFGLFDRFDALTGAMVLGEGAIAIAREVAALLVDLEDEERLDAFLLIALTFADLGAGHTYTPIGIDSLKSGFEGLIEADDSEARARWAAQVSVSVRGLIDRGGLDPILALPGGVAPLVRIGPDRIAHHRLFTYESRLIEAVRARASLVEATIQTDGLERAAAEVWASAGVRLSGEQRYAVLGAIHRPWWVITGGPGTGKTSILVAIVRLAARLGIDPREIALAAPTGKAANRMEQSVHAQLDAIALPAPIDERIKSRLSKARTLHRLLSYAGRRGPTGPLGAFRRHARAPLKARLVLIDEVSMIDMYLMDHLIAALAPGAHLVLLGDAEQLPSVDVGAVLRDLVAPEESTEAPWRALLEEPPPLRASDDPRAQWTARLRRSFRMRAENRAGASILRTAEAVRDGDYEALGAREGPMREVDQGEALSKSGAIFCEVARRHAGSCDELGALMEAWYALIVCAWPAPPELRSVRGGVIEDERERERVRAALEASAGARLFGVTRRDVAALNRAVLARAGRAPLEPGVPVIMTKNDAGHKLFNGDQGIVVSIGGGRSAIAFDREGELHLFGVEAIGPSVETAYAMTVHKSQGSEFDTIALILPHEWMPLVTREVIYTALTRAKSLALVAGERAVFDRGVTERLDRRTLLSHAYAPIAEI